MILNPVYSNQDFSLKPNPRATQRIERLSWSTHGGPDQAQFTATGPAAGVWEFAEYLRCPVVVYDDKANPVWGGFVNEVTINYGSLQWGISLDSMFNSVAVAYSYVEAGSQDVGTRKTTAAATDADSIAFFGTKQLIQSASGMTDAAATAYRDTLLATKKYPSGVVSSGAFAEGNPGRASASISCLGWWETLDWEYGSCLTTSLASTTDQIINFINVYGQFIVATDIDAASGVSTNAYRDGDRTALIEVNTLLDTGNSAGKRLLSSVGVDRRVYIYAEPANTTIGAQIDRLGYLYDMTGRKISIYNPPVGVWCELRDVLPSTVDTTRVINPTLQFIDGVEWTPTNGLIPKFRGQSDLYDTLGGY